MQVNLRFKYDLTPAMVDDMLAAMRAGTFDVKPLPHSDVVSEAERRILKLVARKLAKKPEKGQPEPVFNDGLVILDAARERMKQLAMADRKRAAGADARAR